MVILAVAVFCITALYFYSNISDLKTELEEQKINNLKLKEIKSALDRTQVKIEQLDRKAQTAYDIANNAMLREKREITVRLKRVKTKSKRITLPDGVQFNLPPKIESQKNTEADKSLLKKSGVKTASMETWT